MLFRYKGLDINYEKSGEGPPLLLLHGWGCSIRTMDLFISRYRTSRTVWALDFPGFGGSSYPDGAWEVSDYSLMTEEFIRTLIGESVDVICHSFGGRVMIKLAAGHPELVKRIVFIDAAGVRKKRTLGYYIKVYSYKLSKAALKNKTLGKILDFLKIDYRKRVSSAGSEDYRALPDNMKGTFIKVVNEDLTPWLRDIKAPSLLIYGENDSDTPVSMAKIMEKKIPDAGLVIIENAGHFSFADAPGRVLGITDVFLK